MTDRKDTCANCRFFQLWPKHPNGTQRNGDCRKRAARLGGQWPGVEKTDWCGEHDALPEAVKAEEVKAAREIRYYVTTLSCSECDYILDKPKWNTFRRHNAWHAHKCEDHQPANEESDS